MIILNQASWKTEMKILVYVIDEGIAIGRNL